MKHFFDYINSNKFSLENISEAHVTVTLKIDGTALQLCFDKDKKVSSTKEVQTLPKKDLSFKEWTRSTILRISMR